MGGKGSVCTERVVEAKAYNVGSEVNSESSELIPGPPCGKGGSRDTEGAQGYVHIHGEILYQRNINHQYRWGAES